MNIDSSLNKNVDSNCINITSETREILTWSLYQRDGHRGGVKHLGTTNIWANVHRNPAGEKWTFLRPFLWLVTICKQKSRGCRHRDTSASLSGDQESSSLADTPASAPTTNTAEKRCQGNIQQAEKRSWCRKGRWKSRNTKRTDAPV